MRPGRASLYSGCTVCLSFRLSIENVHVSRMSYINGYMIAICLAYYEIVSSRNTAQQKTFAVRHVKAIC